MDPAQFTELLQHVDAASYGVIGVISALIVAVTWKG